MSDDASAASAVDPPPPADLAPAADPAPVVETAPAAAPPLPTGLADALPGPAAGMFGKAVDFAQKNPKWTAGLMNMAGSLAGKLQPTATPAAAPTGTTPTAAAPTAGTAPTLAAPTLADIGFTRPITETQAMAIKLLVEAGMPLEEAIVAATRGLPTGDRPMNPGLIDTLAGAITGGKRKKKTLRKKKLSRKPKRRPSTSP